MQTLRFWVTLRSLKDFFLHCYVVKRIFQDNKKTDLKDLTQSVCLGEEGV